jgi:hypothetical protein
MKPEVSAACVGKQRFDSPDAARRIARVSGRRTDSNIDVYRCQYCNGWHLGTSTRAQRKGKQ